MTIEEAIKNAKRILGDQFRCISYDTTYYENSTRVSVYIHSESDLPDGMRCVHGNTICEAIAELENVMAVAA